MDKHITNMTHLERLTDFSAYVRFEWCGPVW